MVKALFLDRDGTIIIDKSYQHKTSELEFIPGAPAVLKWLQKDFALVIITNQSGIGQGYFTQKDFVRFQDYLLASLAKEGVKITASYYCPHAPQEKCPCRKPNPHFIYLAQKEFNLDLKKSYFIGDKDEDALCGQAASLKTIRIKSQYPQKTHPDYTVVNLKQAAEIINPHEK